MRFLYNTLNGVDGIDQPGIVGDRGPASGAKRGSAVSGADEASSLSGRAGEDRGDGLVRGDMARAVGGATEPVGGGAEVRGSGSMDRLGLPLAVWAAETDRQQQPLFDSAGLESAECGVASIVPARAAGRPRIGANGSVMGCCCWKRLSIPGASMAACIARRTGWNWDGRGDTGAPGTATAPKPMPRNLSLCVPCAVMRAGN